LEEDFCKPIKVKISRAHRTLKVYGDPANLGDQAQIYSQWLSFNMKEKVWQKSNSLNDKQTKTTGIDIQQKSIN